MRVLGLALAGLLLAACAPKPGTPAWCEALEEEPTLEWTAEEVKGYVRYCVLGESNISVRSQPRSSPVDPE